MKFRYKFFNLTVALVTLGILFLIVSLLLILFSPNINIWFIYFLIFLDFVILNYFFIKTIKFFLNRSNIINSSIYKYINNIIEENNLGLIFYSANGKIIWISSFIKKRFGEKIIGKNIDFLFSDKKTNDEQNIINYEWEYEHLGFEYRIKKYSAQNIITVSDITILENILKSYINEKIVIGELEIDNYYLLSTIMVQEDFFKYQITAINLLDEISNKMNFSYKQYSNGKFLIITNYENFSKFRAKNFIAFKEIETKLSNYKFSNQPITFSIGFSYGTNEILQLNQLAKDALLFSKTRGGNQVTVFKYGDKPMVYGSNMEIEPSISRSELNYVTRILLNVLKKPEIKNIIIYGHKFSDLDALGSAFGLGTFLVNYLKHKYNLEKKFYIQNTTFDKTTELFIKNNKEYISEKYFIKPSQAKKITDENTMVIIVDTADKTRIENEEAFNKTKPENVFIFDHHRIGEQKLEFIAGGNEYIDTTTSSTSEIVTNIINLYTTSEVKYIDSFVAQMLLNGIYMDTKQFSKSTSTKTFEAASFLINYGAQSKISIETLKYSEEIFAVINKLIAKYEEVKPGYLLAYSKYEADIDVISMAADFMLNVQGRKAAIVVAKVKNSEKFKMSARSYGNTNVQIIAERVGGGGHFAASAAESTNETLEVFVDNIRQAIVSVNNESNNNQRI
ncbi:GGDEF domain-containing protein [[Mycoplasma] collis]|uniref:DHH family phosphoesterase n=1 Tax=[Mycoplasma] collis TaxID=2127 RepID=UPI00051BE8BF|nr:DHH family phosphoesterase [[Mycoplasma] collis]